MTMRLRSFWLSVVLAACFVVFLPLSSAYAVLDDYDIQDGEVHVRVENYYTDSSTLDTHLHSSSWNNVTVTDLLHKSQFVYTNEGDTSFIHRIVIRNETEALFAANETAVLQFDGMTNYITLNDNTHDTKYYPWNGYYTNFRVTAYATDPNRYEILPDATVEVRAYDDGTYSVVMNSGVLPFATAKFAISFYTDLNLSYGLDYAGYINAWNRYYLNYGWTNHRFNYSYYPVSSSVTIKIKETVTEVKEELVALPDKLWGVMEEGITGLFVPSEDSFSDMQQQWNELLADRFGALYEVGDLVTEYANAFVESEQDTIDIPTVKVPLGEVDFEFGGWTVQIVPDGFQVVIDALKLIVSIACTFLVVNGLKRRFEGLIGGAPNA